MEKSDIKILVVDDDRRLSALLEDTLTSIGYSATSVTSAQKALNMLSKEKYDLVITDINMPEMDGIALLQVIRVEYPLLPVIFITGKTRADLAGNSKPEGFLAKPFRISNLEDLIEKTMTEKESVTDIKTRRVLVIDDDDSFREMLVEALRVCEFETEFASTPAEAIDFLKRNQTDVVITDIKMPEMDGVSLAKTIKEQYPGMPVILITAYHSFQQSEYEEQTRIADGILQKPFGLELILDMLERVTRSAGRVTTRV